MSNDVLNSASLEPARRRFLVERGEILQHVTLLHQAFELRAVAEPDAEVLVVGEERITCRELNARANQLARFLVGLGVGPEVRVAICAERTAEMVVAMYAVLKAGGAYVPVDPAYPMERQEIILEDSGARFLLTQERLAGRVPQTSAQRIFLDRDWPQIGLESADPLPPLADEKNLAYTIYTSGSTGRPKGVAIAHRSAVVFTRWVARIYSPEELSGVLAATSICFDLSIFELFAVLALGGRSILADHALSLPDLPAAGEVTLINTVPSASAELARSGGIPPSVRTINLAGEALRGALVQRLYEPGIVQKVYNLYGPSEDTTYSTWALIASGDSRPPAIGRLLDGTWGYLLDGDLNRVAGEEPGELYLGGEGLARGYLGRPDLTASRFVPDPFSTRPGERVYATGDLIRYRPDGELDYLGRIDHQVKIRGFRIELGEIEAVLERHPTVGDTVVVALELDGSGETVDKVLVAYVVPRAGAALSVAELREHLQERLAAYMVPTHFVVLDALPLNPNGKVDRAALPKPEHAGERPGFVAPRTPLETALAEIWSEVLQVSGVGVADHFFELGGHSLLAARAIARIHDVLGRRLPPRALFDAPTIESLVALLADLTEGEELAGIPAARERRWTASAGQEAMWFSEHLNAGMHLFTIPLLLHLSGPLDRQALLWALAEIVRRHEVLRVLFRDVNGRPVLTPSEAVVDLCRIDLRALPESARSAEAERAAAALARRRVDLERGPLVQGYLMELDERDHRLLITLHHIVGDDWSIWVFAHDLAALYTAAVTGRTGGLSPLPLQFSDYAAWQREWLEGPEAREYLEFWKRHLRSLPEVLDLPTDRLRPAVPSFRGAQFVAQIPRPDAQALQDLALRGRATLFMAFLAVLDSLLHRYSGQEDLAVGAPTANRHRTGTHELIGLFTNTLILRADFSADPSFDQLLQQIRETVLEGLGHQDFPFDRLIRELQPERSLSHARLAQVLLSFQNTPPLPGQLGPGLDLRLEELGNGTAKVDITIFLRQQGGELVTVWEYATDLFDAPTIDRMSGHFQRLLSAAVADPARRVSELPLLAEAEWEQIARWEGDGDRERAAVRCVHETFSVQAERNPDAPAVRFEDELLTFRELDARAEALARHLSHLGIGPESRVAVCVERSLAMVVAILGVLKSGGAYVPLDADAPGDRLGFVLEDSGARALISQDSLAGVLPPSARPLVWMSSDGLLQGQAEQSAAPRTPAGPENLAYVIYTSGSTGRPKGVMVEHGQLASYVSGVLERMALPEGASFATVSTIAADLGNTVIFAALATGGCLHVISRARLSETAALARYFERHPVDGLKIVPSHLASLLAFPRGEGCLPRRLLITGGEALPLELVEQVRELAPGCRILNHYGPTETTVGILTHEVGPVERYRERASRIPLGKPLRGTRVLVLDPNMAPLPAVIPGELCVGGLQVSRGYLARPDLTAEKFRPDPWSGLHSPPGSRLYSTGDRGRRLPDGSIEFLGRVDLQVKVRGFRVEPGEIEAALRAHPGVAEAVVVARNQRLVAYVVAKPDTPDLNGSALRSFLMERLPDPLVPALWVFLPALPLTLNGKVDRKALPPPEESSAVRETVAPRTPTETALAAFWADVLGLDQVGVHESFFELGGHSLLVMQVVSRVQDSLGVTLSLRQFFELQTIAGLAELVDAAQSGGKAAHAAPRIEPADRGQPLPLSFGQRRLWFLDQLSPQTAVYNLPVPLRIRGELRVAVLERCLEEIAGRHEALRTTFRMADGEPVQVIHPAAPVPLPVVDLRGLPELAREAESARRVEAESTRPFDLAAGPLFRAVLLRTGEEEHVLALGMHHIVSDGWSRGILLRELEEIYESLSAGRPAALQPLPVHYADFAAWQRRWFTGARLAAPLAYWRRQLDGAPVSLEIPSDRPRPNVPSFRGGLRSRALPPELFDALRRLCRSEGVTPYTLMLAAFDTLLLRYTGQEDLVIGCAVAGRGRAEIEGLIGFFVNTVVLRVDLSGDPPFLAALQRAERTALKAYEHQDLPFEVLVEALHPDRDPARNPFFQVMLNSHHAIAEAGPSSGLQLSELDVELKRAKFDLILNLLESESSLELILDYAADLFDPATASRMLGHLEALLAGVAVRPQDSLSTLPLLTPVEIHQLLREWNGGRAPYPREACLHELVGEWVERTPDAVAVVFEESHLTFRELDSRAGLLAGHLRALGVGPEVFVAVAMERSLDLVVSLLAILKAGGAFVPVDPGYPPERIAWLLADSGAPVRISETRFLDRLPADGTRTVLLDSGWEQALAAAPAASGRPARPENVAYMMYTSGTTGFPKGVMVPHRGVVRLVRNNHYARLEGEVFLQVSATSFDASALEVWGALANGARLVVFPGSKPSLEEIGTVVERYGVTLLWLTSGLFQQMVEHNLEGLRPLRQLLTGGDVVSPSHARTALEQLGCTLIDGYGPTESSTFTTSHAMTDPSQVGSPIPIGRPIANTSVYLLDRNFQPVAAGVPGELLAGGDGLARGYHRRPDLTAEKFIPNPAGGEPGVRLYRTGDLARLLPDGRIDLLGRIDQQVKIRGFRVELGEIEAILTDHPAVAQAAAAAPSGDGGAADRRLVAYLVPVPGSAPPAVAVLRDYLRARLPEYMIPSAWVFLDALPLSPNGKVDRRALPRPEAMQPQAPETAAPLTPTQEVLAGIWAEVLKLPSVGVHEDFFDLGGHSLLATQAISRVRRTFKVELPLRYLFEHPTVAGFAETVEAALGAGGGLEAPRIERAPRVGPLPLSFSQSRLWFLDQLLPNSAAYNISYPLEIGGVLDVAVLQGAFEEVVRRHEALRTTFPSSEGEPYQAIAPAGRFPLPVADLGGLAEEVRSREAMALIRTQAQRPFALDTGPLFRATLLKLGRERHVLLLAMHHIVSDGWSMGILLRELMALYDAFAAGRPSPLPELPVQYADFAVWQRQWLTGEALSRQLDYWRRQLAGAPAGLDLPTDFPRPVVQTFDGASRETSLPAEMSAGLKAFCRREGVTLFMLFLAVLDVLLSRYSGQEDVLVGSPIANRNRAETEGLIGFFVNTLVLRTNLEAASSFRDLLHQVRENALAAYGHQDLPFETLVEELRPERDLSRSPLFQVLLSVHMADRGLPSAAGLELALAEGGTESAKFDLSLVVVDSGPALWMGVQYNVDLFEGATADRLLGHFGRLLQEAVADPERGWRDLPLLTDPERGQLLAAFNDTGATSGPEVCLHQLLEAQAARTPDQVALVAPEGRLTYRELNGRADRLARRLRAEGLGPEVLAGVLLDRSADLIVTLFAVLKAGGAYAPLDPQYPKQRVLLMLETARAKVLVTRRRLAEALGDELPQGLRTVFLDPGWEARPEEGEPAEVRAALPDNLAYVIFTSGSTGVPKGVAIQHRSAVAMIRWARAMYSPEEFQGLLASTSVCFDLSVFEIFGTLCEGGKLILAENALALPELEAAGEVVLVNTVPSAMSELLRLGSLPPGIRTVNLAGEPLKGSLVREIYQKLPRVERVVNLYGPSEDTTYSTVSVVSRDAGHPLIGRPLTGRQAYVLDTGMQPVPIGVPGALYLGGEGVTRGYLNRPELTAERYVPNPYGPPGSRLYQVGDLAWFLPTGELDFLGRLDHQVKVRGFRIELGEIEAALTRHPEVREAAVLPGPDAFGDTRLIAYFETDRDLPAGELRPFLKQTLPDHMLPSVFVPLRKLPLTPNGKIDRRALAALPLQPENAVEEERGQAPRGYVEEVLTGIWSEIFGHPVKVDDNFFELGGHSLMATRVVSRIRSSLKVELPLQQIFIEPTLKGLSSLVERAVDGQRAVPLPPISPAPRVGDLALSFPQQRLWFLDRLEPGTAMFNLPAPLRLTGPLDVGALSRSLDEVVRRHESLRTRFGERAGRGHQEVLPASPVPLPWVDLTGLPASRAEEEAKEWARVEARQPFDLVRGPLLRTTLLRLEAEDWVLLVTMHHIVTDGWSTDVFARELRTLYQAFATGLPSPLPELPLQYPDFAVWQRQALNGEVVQTLLEDWKRRFGTDLPALRLPTDRQLPTVPTYRGASRLSQLSPELTRDIRKLAQSSGVTLFMTLLAAFQALLHRYSGQERIIVGSPVAGRNRPELERMIGFFINTLVLPSDLSGGLAFRQVLERAREMALGAYACQDLPFEKLVEALQPVRDKSGTPLFSVMFLLRQHAEGLEASADRGEGLRIEPFGVGTGHSQFDLTLFAAETPEGFLVGVEYKTDLFDATTMDRLLEHYRDLLTAVVADPEIRLEDIPVPPLTTTPAAVTDASPAESHLKLESDVLRDRLASRLSRLPAAQREALERRLKGA